MERFINKKIIKIIMYLIIICICLSSKKIFASNIKLGDVNEDGIISTNDLLMISRHITAKANNNHEDWILKGNRFKAADITENEIIDSSDMLFLLRYVAAYNSPNEIGKKHPEWLELEKEIKVTGISLNKTDIEIEKGKTETITATIEPSDATNKEITWTSSNNSVVEVDKQGKITAKANGTAQITAEIKANGKKATCKVTVITSPTSIKLSKTSMTLEVGKTEELTATIEPVTSTSRTITWSTSNINIATYSKGKVIAKANGIVTISARTNNGKKATCKVIVTTSPKLIKLDKTSYTLDIGKKLTLKATIEPTTSSNKKVTWTTSNSSIAGVSNGIVTAKKAGTAKITAKTSNGKTATCTITVKDQKITGGQAIAEAAVKLACTAAPKGRFFVSSPKSIVYNNNTKAYIDAHKKLTNYVYYASCDIAPAVAIRYAGVDKTMEYKTVPNIWRYLKASKNWKNVGTYVRGNANKSKLQPGDILISSQHNSLYVGKSAVKKKYPNSNADFYEAGYDTKYYPYLCDSEKDKRYWGNTFTIFRHVNANKKLYNKILK